MLVELGLVDALGNAVEVGEEVGGYLPCFVLALLGLAQQVIYERLRVDLLLDIERRGMDDEVAPVLLILAAPDELGIEVGVARVLHLVWRFLLFLEHGLMLRGGNVLSLRLVVLEGFDGFEGGRFSGHVCLF